MVLTARSSADKGEKPAIVCDDLWRMIRMGMDRTKSGRAARLDNLKDPRESPLRFPTCYVSQEGWFTPFREHSSLQAAKSTQIVKSRACSGLGPSLTKTIL